MSNVRICLTTCSGESTAQRLARLLVDRRLAACVNILPRVRSVYRWRGEVHDDPESLLLIKTTDDSIAALRGALKELHDYDLPEVIVLDVADGSSEYLDWIAASTTGGQ